MSEATMPRKRMFERGEKSEERGERLEFKGKRTEERAERDRKGAASAGFRM